MIIFISLHKNYKDDIAHQRLEYSNKYVFQGYAFARFEFRFLEHLKQRKETNVDKFCLKYKIVDSKHLKVPLNSGQNNLIFGYAVASCHRIT